MEIKTPAILLKKQHIFAILSIIGIILILGGYSYYSYEAMSIRESKHNELRSIGALKIDQIIQWQKERIADARNISQSPFFIRGLEAWLHKENNQSLSTDLLEKLSLAKAHFDYKNIFIVSPGGEVLLSIEAEEKNVDGETFSKIIETNRGKEISFTDFYFCPDYGTIHYDIIAPIINKDNVLIADLVLRVDPGDFLYPLIQSWPTPSKSSETLLVRKDGDNVLFLNELRHQKNTALKLSFPLTRIDITAVQAVSGNKGIFEGKDYRGIDVLADIEPVAGTSWFMVVKTDKNEINSELYFRAKLLFVLTSLLILCFGVAMFWIYHYRQRNIYVELLQKERKLSEYNEKFKTTLYSIGDAVITADDNGCINQMNHVAEILTGWKEDEARGKPVEEVFRIINEDTRTKAENPVERVLREKTVAGLANHTLLISKDGKEIPIADSGAPVIVEDGKISGVVLVFRDQSKERETEKLIKTRLTLFEYSVSHTLEELLQKTLDEVCVLTDSPVGFYHFVESDQKTLSLQAWSTRTIQEFCKAEGKGLHYSIDKAGVWADCIKEKKPVIHNDYESHPHKKGLPAGHAPVIRELVVPIIRKNKIGAVIGIGNKLSDYTEKDVQIVSYLADVAWELTEHKKAAEELRESRANYEKFFMEDPTGNLATTKEGKILACNPAFIRIFGFSSVDEALQTNIITLYRNPQERRVLVSRLQEDKKLENLAVEMVRKDGKSLHMIVNFVGRFDSDGNLSTIQTYLFDETRRRQLEDQLVQAQKLESLGTLASGIAHDFNNILGIIMGQTSLMELTRNDQDKLTQRIETIDKATRRGASLVKQLLTFARKSETIIETVKVNNIINEITKLLRETFPKTILVSTELQKDLPSITADATQIHQVLLNLVINARDAMPRGEGRLSILTKTVPGVTVSRYHQDAEANNYVCIELSDTGTGMDETVSQKIFEPFFTTKDIGKGTGLGLALVYGIVTNHKGFIDVESEPGMGTKFSIYLPADVSRFDIYGPSRKSAVDVPGGTETILVVEDEEMLRQLLEIALVSKGYRVLMAENGEEGVETYLRNQKEISLVITDIGLPKLGGHEVFMAIKAFNPDARVIIASGYIDVNVKSELSKAGARYFLQKPYRIEEVYKNVRAAIDEEQKDLCTTR